MKIVIGLRGADEGRGYEPNFRDLLKFTHDLIKAGYTIGKVPGPFVLLREGSFLQRGFVSVVTVM